MAITLKPLSREFHLNGRKLADPDPRMPVDEVRNMLSATYPELNNASYREEMKGSVRSFTFNTAVGTKG